MSDDTATQTDTGLLDRLRAYVGEPFRPPREGKDPVNEPMIRHLVEALGDENPVYVDEEFAGGTVHGAIVAPATSLQVWTMAGLEPPPSDPADKQAEVMGILDDHGYTSVVATNCEQEYERYLRPDDRLTVRTTLEDVAGPKTTGLGEGYFITTLEEYADQHGDVVGRMRFRILKFKPPERRPEHAPAEDEGERAPQTPPRPTPSIGPDNEAFWEGTAADELRIQRCTSCLRLRHPWQPACRHCHSLDHDYVVASGTGEIYSFAVHHHPPLPGFEPPFVIGLIELEEGVRIVGEVVDVDRADVHVGLPVRARFTPIGEGFKIVQWGTA